MSPPPGALRVGLYETIAHHHRFLHTLVRALRSLPACEMHLFVSHPVFRAIEEFDPGCLRGLAVHALGRRWAKSLYNLSVNGRSRGLDRLILNSLLGGLPDVLSYFFLRPRCPYVVTDFLHGEMFSRVPNKFRWGPRLNALFYRSARRHVAGASKLIYLSRQAMAEVAPLVPGKPVLFFPFVFHDERMRPAAREGSARLRFTIPGALHERRDYGLVLDALERLLSASPDLAGRLELLLLGTRSRTRKERGHFDRVASRAHALNARFGEVVAWYDRPVRQDEYRDALLATDVLINPVIPRYYRRQGFTRATCESITFGLPCLYTAGYSVVEELAEAASFFDGAEQLAGRMRQVVLDRSSLAAWRERTLRACRSFSLGEWAPRLHRFLTA